VRLLVDCGNSRIKWAQSDGAWRTGAAVHRDAGLARVLDMHWGGFSRPLQVLVSCVADTARRTTITHWVERHWSLAATFVEAQAQTLDVRNGYREPTRLGPDRWAALIGARGLTADPVCVVDCGTAVTADALSGTGEFLGGVIFPGLTLLRTSLVNGTAAVGGAPGDATSCQARSTGDAVAAGALYGCAGAIARFTEEHKKVLGTRMQLFVSGGDAALLMPLLPPPAVEVPDLVLRGLDRMAAASC
jgi:type III pantothenate kinase